MSAIFFAMFINSVYRYQHVLLVFALYQFATFDCKDDGKSSVTVLSPFPLTHYFTILSNAMGFNLLKWHDSICPFSVCQLIYKQGADPI